MSHHFDSPTAREDGRVDLSDLYVFPGENSDTTVLILTVNPDAGLSSPITFRPNDALYEFNIDLNNDVLEDISYRITFGNPNGNNVQFMQVRVAEGETARTSNGAMGELIAEGLTGEVISVANGGRIWAGLAADPFFADAGGLAKFLSAISENRLEHPTSEPPQNWFDRRNVSGIVLEVPNYKLNTEVIRVWTTVSLFGHVPQQQVNRQGMPLLQPIFNQEDEWSEQDNRTHPKDDRANLQTRVANVVAKATEIAGTAANPQAYGLQIANLLLPDVLTYCPSTAASFSFAGLNGRTLNDDVFDIIMTIVANTPLTDRVDSPHHLPLSFPYLDSPYHDQKGVLPFLNRSQSPS